MILMICSVVGVGFVSGAEIYQFFARFGKFSYLGIFVFFVSLFYLTNKILKENQEIENVSKMNNFYKNNRNNTFLKKFNIKSKLMFFNVLMMASAMFSGLFHVINQLFLNNYLLVVCAAVFIIFVILIFGIKGLEKFDYFVITFIIFISVFLLVNTNTQLVTEFDFEISENIKNLPLSTLFALIYIFINIIQIQPIIAENKVNFESKNTKTFAFLFAFLMTMILTIFVKFIGSHLYLVGVQMPLLKFFKNVGGVICNVFIIGLLLALFSSLLAALVGVKNKIKNKISSNFLATLTTIVLALGFSLFGFSNFIKIIYPIVGIINFVIYVFL